MTAEHKVQYVKDSVAYDLKPTSEETAGIKVRLGDPRNQKVATVEELAQDCLRYSIAPIELAKGAKGALSKKSFKSQQAFKTDIDNEVEAVVNGRREKVKVPEEQYVDLEGVLDICREGGVDPAFICHSISHTEEHCKLHVVFVTEEPVRDVGRRNEFIQALNRLLTKNGHFIADQKCLEEGRLFYPGQSICYEDYTAVVDVEATIRKGPIVDDEDDDVKERDPQDHVTKKRAKEGRIITRTIIDFKDIT